MRTRRGVASAASPSIRGRSRVTRQPPRRASEAVSIVPETVTGPMRRSSTGAATAALRIWASAKPAASAASAIRTGAAAPRLNSQAAATRAADTAPGQWPGSTGSEK